MTRPTSIAAACPHMSDAVRRLNGLCAPVAQKQADKPSKPTLRQSRAPKTNKTEAAFAALLRSEYPGAAIREQAVTLRLANGCRYTPDICLDGVSFYEVKGFMRDDAAVKLKVAASQFPEYRFHLVRREKSGGWRIEEVMP